MGKVWTVQDAAGQFAAVVEAAQRGEPQHLTDHGVNAVVVVSADDYQRLLGVDVPPPKNFVDHILDFPPLSPEMNDIFDFDRRLEIDIQQIDFAKS